MQTVRYLMQGINLTVFLQPNSVAHQKIWRWTPFRKELKQVGLKKIHFEHPDVNSLSIWGIFRPSSFQCEEQRQWLLNPKNPVHFNNCRKRHWWGNQPIVIAEFALEHWELSKLKTFLYSFSDNQDPVVGNKSDVLYSPSPLRAQNDQLWIWGEKRTVINEKHEIGNHDLSIS